MHFFVTGAGGFVGQNVVRHFGAGHRITAYNRKDLPEDADIFLHLAGKAHDLKNSAEPGAYYLINTELTKQLFDSFLSSSATVFIFLSSVKAAADTVDGVLDENDLAKPATHYGKSKLLAEQYLLSQELPAGKRLYILRPCMIHGPGNKGNLNLLYKVVMKGMPWPLGAFNNSRSFCSIDNLLFVMDAMVRRADIPSGIYNVADDTPLSTVDLIRLMAQSLGRKPRIWNLPAGILKTFAKIGDVLGLPLDTERLGKLTENYIVSNRKLVQVLGKDLPLDSRSGLIRTLASFKKDVQ